VLRCKSKTHRGKDAAGKQRDKGRPARDQKQAAHYRQVIFLIFLLEKLGFF